MKIGIPKTLFFYTYLPFWKSFFQELGCEVVISGNTNKEILDLGVRDAVNDACVPIKVYHGHVAYLKDKVDYIFSPRIVSVRRLGTETFCPKFLGLPDMIRFSINGLPPLIDVRIDLKKGVNRLLHVCLEVGNLLDKSRNLILKAYRRANLYQGEFDSLKLKGFMPDEALDILENGMSVDSDIKAEGEVTIGVVGYPYILYDRFINLGLMKKLRAMGVKIITPELIPDEILNQHIKKLPKYLFWHYSHRVIGAALYFMENPKIDGIIHVSAFACGPDSMTGKLIELEAKNRKGVNFMVLTIDENLGEAGIITRIEAFVDMIKYRRNLL